MTIPTLLQPRRILVCQQRQIGDVLLTTPALELLKQRYPEAELHVLTERKCLPVLEHNPHVDRIWPLDKAAMPTLLHEVRWYWHVARTGYDLVVNFQPTLPRLRWVVGFSAAQVRLTTTPPWYLRPLYTHVVSPTRNYAAASKVDVLLPLGITWKGERPRLYLIDQERTQAGNLLTEAGLASDHTLLTLDPTHRQPTRRWPVEHYARLVSIMTEQAISRGVILRFLPLWGPGEEQDIQNLRAQAARLGCEDTLLTPRSMLSLRESAACIERAALHIGNCSAPRHMAVAVGTPSCSPTGSTGPEWTCPPLEGCPPDHLDLRAGLPCQPCEENHCRLSQSDADIPCMSALSPETVAKAAFNLLSRSLPALHEESL